MKQIGLAVHNYHDTFQSLPPGGVGAPPPNFDPTQPQINQDTSASALVFILPYLEQGNKYNQFNFATDLYNDPSNSIARMQDISTYLCPSDPSSATFDNSSYDSNNPGPLGRSNYFANHGIGATLQDPNNSTVGPFNWYPSPNARKGTTLTGITDGTSNTALFSEILRSRSLSDNQQIMAVIAIQDYNTFTKLLATLPTPDVIANYCESNVWFHFRYAGLEYYRAYWFTSNYTHLYPPNYQHHDCVSFANYPTNSLPPYPGGTGGDSGLLGARSAHTGGVNVTFADGSVHFVRDSVDITAWRALGTQAGGEVFDASQF